jgi:hypothetical protein
MLRLADKEQRMPAHFRSGRTGTGTSIKQSTPAVQQPHRRFNVSSPAVDLALSTHPEAVQS